MEFFLPFQIQSFPFKISYADKILFTGSCFSQEIGNKMSALKFKVLQNPNGILYDPLSIAHSLTSYIHSETYTEENLVELNGLWHSWAHHSMFSGSDKNKVLRLINESQISAHQFLKQSTLLIITLGTAFVYKLKSNQQPVSNCHKAPASLFDKKLLATEKIVASLTKVIDELQAFNPALKIMITVSPVKHVRDGVAENNRSKARLIDAAHSIVEAHNHVFYFPSFELVADVLRDYRFYKDDLVHPNDLATQFVFEKFYDALADNTSKEIAGKIARIINAVNHKPFASESILHQQFIDNQLEYINKVEKDHPFIDLREERAFFMNAKINLLTGFNTSD